MKKYKNIIEFKNNKLVIDYLLVRPGEFINYRQNLKDYMRPLTGETEITEALRALSKAGILFEKRMKDGKNYRLSTKSKPFKEILNGYYMSDIKTLINSNYMSYMIEKRGIVAVFDLINDKLIDFNFKKEATTSLLNLPVTKKEYNEFARNIQINISEIKPHKMDPKSTKNVNLSEELNKIHEDLSSKKLRHIEILGYLQTAEAVQFYRKNIHKSVKEGLNHLYERNVITKGLREFLFCDNYLSPFTSYPVNGTLQLLISQQFQRIYNSAYLLKGNSLDLLSQRAAVIYEFFPDILFELFSFDPPEKKYIESIVKQLIFYWNVASTRFDYCYYFAEKCMQEPGNYHITSDGFSYSIIDLERDKPLLTDSVERSILWKGSIPRTFVYAGDHRFDDELMDNPFDSLRPCVTFSDLGIRDDAIPFNEIMAELGSRLAELRKEDKRE